MKKLALLILCLLIFEFNFAFSAAVAITDYHQVFFPVFNSQGDLRIIIRTYYRDNKLYYLAVNPTSLMTETAPAKNYAMRILVNNYSKSYTMRDLQQTLYFQALKQSTSPPYSLQNYGITRPSHPIKGMFLTVDMCPSRKKFESAFFNELVKISERMHRPMPVAIAMTGSWILNHPEEFKWLIDQQNKHQLAITWINHSFSHSYYPDLPLNENFLLAPLTNFTQEVLATEKLLLAHQQLPSVFFRFPGLISNETLIKKLHYFGLITLGTNAWLAKGEMPREGSIILVHGNSNEPQGIIKIMPLLKNPNSQWLPINSSLLPP